MMESCVKVAVQMGENHIPEKDEIFSILDSDITAFSNYMAQLPEPGAGALNNPEKALLKTYLVGKIRGKF
jgi:hypothetical protein